MAGYTRQSVADIISGEVVKAAPLNAEFNALRDAFTAGTGHTHDGTTGNGAYITTIAGEEGFNKVFVDETNNRISFFIEISGAAVEQLRIQDGAIVPVTDDDIDLGASGAEFKDLYIDGIGYIDSVVITGGSIDDTTIGATTPSTGAFTTLSATGTSTLSTVDINAGNIDNTAIGSSTASTGAFTTLSASGNATFNGNTTIGNADTDTVTVTADVSSPLIPSADDTYDLGAVGSEWRNLYVDDTANIDSLVADTADINGGNVDGTVIGASTPAAITGTTVTANTGFSGNLTGNVSGNVTSTGTSTFATVDINGGAIDGTTIGANSATTGAFTTLSATGTSTLSSVDINAGAIDNTTIGAATPSTGAFTTASASGGFSGNLTGNVTGNLSGNVTSSGANSFGSISTSGNAVIGGNLTVNGTTTTVSTTNTTIEDGLIELGTGTTGTPASDAGIVIERGDEANAFIGYDESANKFTVGTGTFTGASTGDLTITTGTMVADIEGDVTGDLTGNVSGNITSTGTSSFNTLNATTASVTGTVSYGSLSDGTITITAFADEDDMVSDSATLVPTQQSVKKYVDDQVAVSYDVTGLTATGTELNAVADVSEITIDTSTAIDGADGLAVFDSSAGAIGYFDVDLLDTYLSSTTKTLPNKTLSSPSISGLYLSDSGFTVEGSSADDFEMTVSFTNPTADRTMTFPDETGTVATQTYANTAADNAAVALAIALG